MHETFPSSSSLLDLPTSTPAPSSPPSPDAAPQSSPFPPSPLPSSPSRDPHNLLEIKHRTSTAIYSLLTLILPRSFLQTLFNPPTSPHSTPTQQIEDSILDVFGDEYLNRHLLYSVLECVVVRIVPEMGMEMSEGGGGEGGVSPVG